MAVVDPLLPLVLDLDGTLIRTDTFHEMMVYLLTHKPWVLLLLPFWFLKGRAFAKARLTDLSDLSPHHLPYNPELLAFAQAEVQKGRPLILATGTDQRVAQKIADHLGIFQEVIGSDGHTNMTGPHKQKALLERYGAQGFDYAGDSRIDTHIWQVARYALVVHPKWGVLKDARVLKQADYIHHFPRGKLRFWAFFLALRPWFWLVNLMVFPGPLFISLNLLTSGLFMAGDLLSLSKERTRQLRKSVFAEGHLHLITAFILILLFVVLSILFLALSHYGSVSFILIYVPLFIGFDVFTRPFPQGIRWTLLVIFQYLALWALKV